MTAHTLLIPGSQYHTMKVIQIFIILIVAVMIVAPVTATITPVSANGSSTVSSSYKHDSNYMPFQYEAILIAIGLSCLAISRIFKAAEDIFAIIAVLPLGLSAYFANYMSMDSTYVAVVSGVVTTVNVQIITASPYLSYVMDIATLAAVFNILWVFLLQPADAATSGEKEQR